MAASSSGHAFYIKMNPFFFHEKLFIFYGLTYDISSLNFHFMPIDSIKGDTVGISINKTYQEKNEEAVLALL